MDNRRKIYSVAEAKSGLSQLLGRVAFYVMRDCVAFEEARAFA